MPGEIGSRTEQVQCVRPDPGRIKVMRHIGSRTDKSDASHRIPDGQGGHDPLIEQDTVCTDFRDRT